MLAAVQRGKEIICISCVGTDDDKKGLKKQDLCANFVPAIPGCSRHVHGSSLVSGSGLKYKKTLFYWGLSGAAGED